MEFNNPHVRLFVSEIAPCAEFYKDVLKFKPVTIQVEKGYAEFELDHLQLSLFRRQEMSEILRTSDRPSLVDEQDKFGLILHVHNLDDIYHKLRQKGVAFAEPPTQNKEFSIKVAYFRDPSENLLGLIEPLM